MEETEKRKIYVFDFDGTLTKHDSFILFAKHSVGLKNLILGMAECFPWLIGWKLGLCSNSIAKEHLFKCLYKGIPLSKFKDSAEAFVEILNKDTGNAFDKFKSAIENKQTVYILSASIEDWIIPWAQQHGIPRENVISTKMKVDENDIITGSFSSPNCHGKEKIRRFLEVEHNRESYYLIAYGDSKSDIPFLNFADEGYLI